MARTASENLLVEVLSRCKQQAHCGLLLNAILVAFKPAYVASRSMEFVNFITECDDDDGESMNFSRYPKRKLLFIINNERKTLLKIIS